MNLVHKGEPVTDYGRELQEEFSATISEKPFQGHEVVEGVIYDWLQANKLPEGRVEHEELPGGGRRYTLSTGELELSAEAQPFWGVMRT